MGTTVEDESDPETKCEVGDISNGERDVVKER